MGKTVIVAGIGSRKNVSAGEVLAAVDATLQEHGLAATALSALATIALKKDEQAILAAGEELGLPVIVVDGAKDEDGSSFGPATLTRSQISQAVAGVPSVCEAAALAAAGAGGKLLGPRTIVGRVTCAIAVAEERP